MIDSRTVARPRFKKGDRLGDWVLVADRPLGRGGQAEVWKARHVAERHSPAVALKICLGSDAKAKARFAKEVGLLRQHAHASIVGIRDKGEHNGTPFLAMDLATTTLERVITGESAGLRLLQESPAVVLDFFRQACAGVAHLHANDVLHRDIKPSNLLLFLDPPQPMRAVLADLGIGSPAASQGNLTSTQEGIGTSAYRAPEVALGPHTKASDVYSLGKTLEFVFTRRVPPGFGPGLCLRDARIAAPLWERLDAILQRACAFRPEDRYEDAAGFLDAIPAVVLTSASIGSSVVQPSSGAIALHDDEAQVLVEVIGACAPLRAAPSVSYLQRESRLSNFAFSLAIHRLRMLKFVEMFSADDDRGEAYEAVRMTDAALQWAVQHRDQVSRPEDPAPARSDDDIPF